MPSDIKTVTTIDESKSELLFKFYIGMGKNDHRWKIMTETCRPERFDEITHHSPVDNLLVISQDIDRAIQILTIMKSQISYHL